MGVQVKRKLNETNFLVATPDQKCKSRVCHVNKLKTCVDEALSEVTADQAESSPLPASTADVGVVANYSDEDDLMNRDVLLSSTSLNNSVILDVPGRSTMCVHEMNVGDAVPIKQRPY